MRESRTAAEAATTETIANYRDTVTKLLDGCIERIRERPLPDGIEPLTKWKPDRD